MSNYSAERAWSDQFIPAIKQIVGPLLLEESSFEVDTRQAADLVVMNSAGVTIACRMRRMYYFDRWPDEFTIRSRSNGHKTELSKIIDGWAQLMFYGFGDDGIVNAWRLIDLRVFRATLARANGRRGALHKNETSNGDGTAFVPFLVNQFPPNLVIAAGGMFEGQHVLPR